MVFSAKKQVLLGGLVTGAAALLVLIYVSFFCSKTITNVVLISIDTCRADHLSCYGFEEKTTPNIDAIADEGILFENTISPVSFTLPAHSSMLTGTIPPYHGVHNNSENQLGQANVTLAERLKENGFTTGAIISAFVLDSCFGIDQGFDSYNDRFEAPLKKQHIEQRAGGETTRFANEWLEENKAEKFFLFLHYFDPHFTYDAPEPFGSRFMLDPYAGEIAYTDHCIGQVIDKLKELGLYDSTLLIITSDHGESLREHGEKTHGYFIYQSTIRIPLIFRTPGGPEGVRIGRNVGLVDITPTVCKLLGIEFSNEIQGKDLTGYIKDPDSEPYPDRYLYCQSLEPTKYNANPLLGVVADRYKYILTSNSELYDLYEDPDEMLNLIKEQPNRARLMQDKLEQILEQSLLADTGRVQFDDEILQRLASLGYVSGSVDEDFELDENRDDPKDLIEYHELNANIQVFTLEEKYDAAAEVCQQMISLRPDLYNAYCQLGEISLTQKDYADAAAYLEKAIELKPDNVYSHIKLTEAFNALGKPDKAIEYFLKALEIDPECGNLIAQKEFDIDIRSLSTQCGILIAQKKFDEAKIAAAKIVSLRPDYYVGYNRLAEIAMKEARFPESMMYLKKVLEFDPENFYAHDNLGRGYNSVGKFDEALKHFSRALQIDPNDPEVHNNIGNALQAQGKFDEAISHYQRALQIKPDYAGVHYNLGNLLRGQGSFDEAVKHYHSAVQIDPKFTEVFARLGMTALSRGSTKEAIGYLRLVLEARPDFVGVLNGLAWIFATCKDTKLYNPTEAVKLAERACVLTGYQRPELLDTLAAAYGAAGMFEKALEISQKAFDLAISENNNGLAESIKKKQDLYKQGKTYIDPRI